MSSPRGEADALSHSPEGKCSVFHRKGLSFLVGWSNLRLSQQPLPEPAQTRWARGQGQLKEAPSEQEVGEQAPGTRPSESRAGSRCNPCQLQSGTSSRFPAVHRETGNEQAWSWASTREGSDLCQEEARAVLSAGLGIAPGPLRVSAMLIILGWQLQPSSIPAWELRRTSLVQDLTREHSSPGWAWHVE